MYMYYTTEWDHLLINFMIIHLCDNSLMQPHSQALPQLFNDTHAEKVEG